MDTIYRAVIENDRSAIEQLITFGFKHPYFLPAFSVMPDNFVQTTPPTRALMFYTLKGTEQYHWQWNGYHKQIGPTRVTPTQPNDPIPEQYNMLILQGVIPQEYIIPALVSRELNRIDAAYLHITFRLPSWITTLYLTGCSGVNEVPFPAPVSIEHLTISRCIDLNMDISMCVMLQSFTVQENHSLVMIPALPRLVNVHVCNCSKLNIINALPGLQCLYVEGCPELRIPKDAAAISQLTSLTYYSVFREFPDSITMFPNLQTLDISKNMYMDDIIPPHIGRLRNLRNITLPAISDTSPFQLPRSFIKLHRLSGRTIRMLPNKLTNGASTIKELRKHIILI